MSSHPILHRVNACIKHRKSVHVHLWSYKKGLKCMERVYTLHFEVLLPSASTTQNSSFSGLTLTGAHTCYINLDIKCDSGRSRLKCMLIYLCLMHVSAVSTESLKSRHFFVKHRIFTPDSTQTNSNLFTKLASSINLKIHRQKRPIQLRPALSGIWPCRTFPRYNMNPSLLKDWVINFS